MKICKFVMTVCMVTGLSMSSANAKALEATQTTDSKVGISKEDAQMLFGTQKANVVVLTQKEMGETKGEFLGVLLTGLGLGLAGWLLNGDVNFQWAGDF